MADKIIDIDPLKRLSKDSLARIKNRIKELDVDDLDSIVIITKPKTRSVSVEVYGLDFETIGFAQAVLMTLSQDILADQFAHLTNDAED